MPILTQGQTSAESIDLKTDEHFIKTVKPAEGSALCEAAEVQYANLFRHGENISKDNLLEMKAHTDDATNIVFIDGQPSIIIADGGFGSHYEPPQKICKEIVPGLLPGVVDRLNRGENVESVMTNFFDIVKSKAVELDKAYERHGGAQFTFACAVVYTRGDKTRVATIGVGTDTMMIYRPSNPEDTRYISLKLPVIVGQKGKDFLPEGSRTPVQLSFDDSECLLGDQIVGLSDGAFLLPTGTAEGHNVIQLEGENNPNGTAPSELLAKTKARIDGTRLEAQGCIGDDGVVAFAQVQSPEAAENIKKLALDHEKNVLSTMLKELYPRRPRMFGHHHHDRRNAVCRAIEQARTLDELKEVLLNQKGMWADRALVRHTPQEDLLNKRWSDKTQLKNQFSETSGYVRAIDTLYDYLSKSQPGINIISETAQPESVPFVASRH